MATFTPRSRDDIFQAMLLEKKNYQNLDGLNDQNITDEQSLFDKLTSPVNTVLWVLWIHLTAFAIWALENVLATGIAEQEEIRDSSFIGNADWVEFAAKQFQIDDVVIINSDTNKIEYAVPDESKQIIGHVAAISAGGAGLIKIRGKNTDVLTENEFNQFQTFWERVGILGVNYTIQNSNPDQLKIIGTLRYKGEKSKSEVSVEVERVINTYIRNISLNSEFVINDMLQMVRSIDGVTDFEIEDIQARSFTGDYSGNKIKFRYLADAGYLGIDASFPLSDTIIYEIERIY